MLSGHLALSLLAETFLVTNGLDPDQDQSKLFDTLIVFLKKCFEKVKLERSQHMTTKRKKNYPACKELKILLDFLSSVIFFQN